MLFHAFSRDQRHAIQTPHNWPTYIRTCLLTLGPTLICVGAFIVLFYSLFYDKSQPTPPWAWVLLSAFMLSLLAFVGGSLALFIKGTRFFFHADEQEKAGARPDPSRYELSICGRDPIYNPTDAEIRDAIMSLDTGANDAFLILGVGHRASMQINGDHREGFLLDYHDEQTDRHYRAKDHACSTQLVTQALIAYRHARESEWKPLAEWEHQADL